MLIRNNQQMRGCLRRNIAERGGGFGLLDYLCRNGSGDDAAKQAIIGHRDIILRNQSSLGHPLVLLYLRIMRLS